MEAVTTRAEAIIRCQHYCVYSAHENLRGTEMFYSHGVQEAELSCQPQSDECHSTYAVCFYHSDRDGDREEADQR